MANGKAHDHPLTDILFLNLEVYGREEDALVRKIAALSSSRELDTWWESEIGWQPDHATILPKTRARLAFLEARAKESGWERVE